MDGGYLPAPAILTKSFPPQQRGQALGMQATMTYLGLTVGPSLGGWLTQTLGWRSVFYINGLIGLLAFGLSIAFIKNEKLAAASAERFDWLGAVRRASVRELPLESWRQPGTWAWCWG